MKPKIEMRWYGHSKSVAKDRPALAAFLWEGVSRPQIEDALYRDLDDAEKVYPSPLAFELRSEDEFGLYGEYEANVVRDGQEITEGGAFLAEFRVLSGERILLTNLTVST